MPQFRVTDPTSGKSFMLTGDSAPSEQELNQIFSSVSAPQSSASFNPWTPPTGYWAGQAVKQKLSGIGSGIESLFSAGKPIFDIPQTPATNVVQGLQHGAEGLINSLGTVGGVGAMMLAQPELALPKTGLAAGGALLAAKPVAQSLGVLSPGSGATPGQRGEAAVLPASIALAPFAHSMARDLFTPEERPQLRLRPQPQPISTSDPAKATIQRPAFSGISPVSVPNPSPTASRVFTRQQYSPEDLKEYLRLKQASTPKTQADISSPDFQANWKAFEQLRNKYGGMPPAQAQLDAAMVQPVTWKPALRFPDNEVMQVDAHNETAKVITARGAKGVGGAQHGFLGSDGKFYTLPEVARKQMEQQSNNKQNETRQQNGQTKTKGNAGQDKGQAQGGLPQQGQKAVPTGQQPDARGAGVGTGSVLTGKGQSLDMTAGQEAKYPLSVSEKGGLKDALGRKVDAQHRTTGESGFVFLPHDTWKGLFNDVKVKVAPEQLLNRLRNKLGEASSAFKALKDAGISGFLSQPRSVEETEDWANKNMTPVEVRKFGDGGQITPNVQRIREIEHALDTVEPRWNQNRQQGIYPESPSNKALVTEWEELAEKEQRNPSRYQEQSHWQSIAPKSEQDMPGYTEIAVVRPYNKAIEGDKFAMRTPSQDSGVQFPSTHSFPPNTLGFARGYMETLPNGKKVFHVIEVQSDWAQRVRDIKESGGGEGPGEPAVGSRAYEQLNDPLLKHYERLVLKAAIDHARSEGADAIAISDAETAMMTEGHDRAHAAISVSSEYSEPDQAPGMRLHYDQTLPKIAGELTGEKGERVEFGEHKMAVTSEDMEDDGRRIPRKDPIFRENGQPKTSITARMFNLGKAKPLPKEFSLYGKGGYVNVPQEFIDFINNGIDKVGEWFDKSGKPAFDEVLNRMRGNALPRTAAISKPVAARLYNYAQANAVSDVLADIDPKRVLGWNQDPAFDKKLGSVLVEYNLRNEGQTSVGKPWSIFKTEKDYTDALNDPAIKDAIDRHADIVLKEAEERHSALGGELLKLDNPKMFVNLKYVPKEETVGKGPTGNLKATLQRKTRFGMERKGTADQYETSYTKLAQRMIKANYGEYQRKLLNDSYVKNKLGAYVGPGDAIPAGHVEIPVRLQRAVLLKEGESPNIVNQNKSLYVRKDLAPEYLQAMQAQHGLMGQALRTVADIMTKVQVQLGVDAVQHSINILSAVDGVVRANWGENLIGAKEVGTVSRIAKNVYKLVSKDQATQELLRSMAADYGLARENATYQGLLGGKSLGGTAIRGIDKAGRLTLFQIAKELAKEGLIKDEPTEIQNFVNKHLGQYNTRLSSAFTQFAKATFSPFIIAGKTFNRLGASRLLLSPQVKAANPQAWATMRARQALYTVVGLVVVPAVLNYEFNKQAFPEDTKIGEVKLPNGKIVDPWRFALLRRGERVTGLGSLIEGQVMPRLRGEQPEPVGMTARQSAIDIARGFAAPYVGPLPNMVAAVATGKTALDYQAAQPGEKGPPYFGAAARQANPFLGAGMTDQPRTGLEKRGEQMIGLRDSNPRTIVNNFRRQFLYKIGKAQQGDDTPSEYLPLRDALLKGDVETAKKEYATLLQEKTTEKQGDQHAAELELQEYFNRFPKSHGQTDKNQEAQFVKTLTYHQQQLLKQAEDSQQKASDLFFSQIQQKINTKAPRGLKPPRVPKSPHFSTRF